MAGRACSTAALIFFAYVGFDSVSTHARGGAIRGPTCPIGILASLVICTILYIAVAAVVTGMVPYPQIPLHAPIAGVFEAYGLKAATVIITIGALTHERAPGDAPQPAAGAPGDGSRRPAAAERLLGRPSPLSHPHRSTILTGAVCG